MLIELRNLETMKRIATLVAVLIFLFSQSCKNCCEEIDCQSYRFRIPIKIESKRDTFAIGDTITFISEFGHELIDEVDGRKYVLANYQFYPTIRLEKINAEKSNTRFTEFAEAYAVAKNYSITDHSNNSNSLIF